MPSTPAIDTVVRDLADRSREAAARGDLAGQRAAETEILRLSSKSTRKLGRHFARKYHLPYEDTDQEIAVAVIEAARSYDPSRGACWEAWLGFKARHRCQTLMERMRFMNLESDLPGGKLDRVEAIQEPAADLSTFLDRLDPVGRLLIELRYGIGRPALLVDQIASLLSLAPADVASALRDALDSLRPIIRHAA